MEFPEMLFGLGFFVKWFSVYLFTEFIPVLSHLSFLELFGDIISKSPKISIVDFFYLWIKINVQPLNFRSRKKSIHEGKKLLKRELCENVLVNKCQILHPFMRKKHIEMWNMSQHPLSTKGDLKKHIESVHEKKNHF